MNRRVLILRPQPGAAETAARARALGLEPIVAPLFEVRALPWAAPDPAGYDAVTLTSANAARLGGEGLTPFLPLPCWTVGEATAEAATGRGFAQVRIGPRDGAALLDEMAEAGIRAVFHPCGADHIPLRHPKLRIERVAVYVAEALDEPPAEIQTAIDSGALILLHSPRAARRFASLIGGRRGMTRLATLSTAVAKAAGEGWRSVDVAAAPRDAALLELAAKLCQTERD